MRWLVGTALRHAVVVVALAIIGTLAAVRAIPEIPLDVFPEFAPPIVEVQTEAPGLSTPEVEALVSVPAFDPNSTPVAALNPDPVTVTVEPPASGPAEGDTPDTTGNATYVNSSAEPIAETPPTVVTVTSTVPAACAGAVAVISESETTSTFVAGDDPKSTADAPVNPEPEIVTTVPPVVGPDDGATLDTIGPAGAW